MKSVFIIIPSLSDTGPVLGALALANGLSSHLSVTVVALKPATQPIDINELKIEVISLADISGWRIKKGHMIQLLQESGGRNNNVSISSCFSADMFNCQLRKYARVISSVRGNLLKVYRLDYGLHGFFAALLHYIVLHKFDHVVAISKTMARQLRFFGISAPLIIRNFVDEPMLENDRIRDKHFDGIIRFAFLGRLTTLKRPLLLIQAYSDLLKSGGSYHLDIIGDGPLRQKLKQTCRSLGLVNKVTFHGHLSNPYGLLQQCHFLVLPSKTEGISRAVLEGLYYGIPCILRDVDANYELVDGHKNCYLFKKNADLAGAMETAARSFRRDDWLAGTNLLPDGFHQDRNIKKYLGLILDNGN